MNERGIVVHDLSATDGVLLESKVFRRDRNGDVFISCADFERQQLSRSTRQRCQARATVSPLRSDTRINMLIKMRTTIVLDDELAKRAKQRANERNSTLSELINEALRDALREVRHTEPAPFKMVTFGDPAHPVHREPAELEAVLGEEEVDALRRSRNS